MQPIPVFIQGVSRRLGRRSLYVMLAMVIGLLVACGLPVMANTGQASHRQIASVSPMEQGRNLFAAGQLAAAAKVWQQAARFSADQGSQLDQARALHYLALTYFNLGPMAGSSTSQCRESGLFRSCF